MAGLLHPCHKAWKEISIKGMIAAAAASCGIFAGLTDASISTSTPFDIPEIIRRAGSLAEKVRIIIADIPFRESSTNSLITALITGDRSGIPDHMLTAFRDSGASHILALSGLHLGIIYTGLNTILSILGNSPSARRTRSICILALCGTYTLATGAGASITRAMLYILLGEVGRLAGRQSRPSDILAGALFIQLAISPGSASDVGFQLSYAAMAGITFIYPWLKGLWPEGKAGIMRWVWNSAALSTSCQITTGPLAYLHFGTFPKYFILTNLMGLPLIGVIIPLGLLTTLLHALGMCPELLVSITEKLVSCLTWILTTVASI